MHPGIEFDTNESKRLCIPFIKLSTCTHFLIQTSLITFTSQISPLAVYDPKLCEFQVSTYSNNILSIESPIPLFGIWPHSRDETEMNGWTDDRETRYTKCTHFFGSLLLRNIPPPSNYWSVMSLPN